MAKNRNRRGKKASSGPGKNFYLILGLVVVAGVVALLALRGGGTKESPGRPVSLADLSAPADSTVGIAAGAKDAPVKLIEFADYTCPHCAEFTRLAGRALRQNLVQTGKLRWVMFDFPLSQNTNAIPGALAARCAGAQGDYWPMHDLLFGNQLDWVTSRNPESHFADYAKQAGVDVGKWKSCYENKTYLRQIMASRNYGLQLGVNSTPTLFLNGKLIAPRDHTYGAIAKLVQQDTPSGSQGGS